MPLNFTAEDLFTTMLDYKALSLADPKEWTVISAHMGHDLISPFDTARNIGQVFTHYTQPIIEEFKPYLAQEDGFMKAFTDLKRIAPVDGKPSMPRDRIRSVADAYHAQLQRVIEAAPEEAFIDGLMPLFEEDYRQYLAAFTYFHNRFVSRNNNYFGPEGAYRTDDIASAITQYVQDEAPDLEKLNIILQADVQPHVFKKNPTLFVIDPLVQNSVTHAFKEKSPPHYITIEGWLDENGENYVCTVKDNGIGIPEDKLGAMFKKNISSRGELSSVHGQGLLNVGEFFERYGGSITAGNHADGAYTTFTVPTSKL